MTKVSYNDFKKKFAIASNSAIPQTVVELPSDGAKASLIPMKVREQKDFLKALEKKNEYLINEAFDAILAKCVLTVNDEPFDNDKLCLQDRLFLLLKVRQLTTGDIAKITHVCPKSQEVVTNIEVDLTKLPVDKFEGKSLFAEVQLTEAIKCVLGPVTRKDEKSVEKWLKATQEDPSLIDRRYCSYGAVLKTILIKKDKEKPEDADEWEEVEEISFDNKIKFITEACTQKDLEKIDPYFKTLDFGVRIKFPFKSKVYENPEEETEVISFFIM